DRTAPLVLVAAPQLEGDTHDVVAGVDEHRRGDRRIDPAGHRHEHPHRRSRRTASPIASTAAATSASVVGRPTDSRTEVRASCREIPIAARTWDGSIAPLAHDEP